VRPGVPGGGRRGPYATAGTAEFVRSHPAPLEVDLQRWYQTDLRDLWRPGGGASRLTYRRLRVLVDGLPPESATKTAIRDTLSAADFKDAPEPDGWGTWSNTDQMLASIYDELSRLRRDVYSAQGGGKPEYQEPMRRPGVGLGPADKRALRLKQRQTAALVAYTIAHDGAYPPAGWVPDIDDN